MQVTQAWKTPLPAAKLGRGLSLGSLLFNRPRKGTVTEATTISKGVRASLGREHGNTLLWLDTNQVSEGKQEEPRCRLLAKRAQRVHGTTLVTCEQ